MGRSQRQIRATPRRPAMASPGTRNFAAGPWWAVQFLIRPLTGTCSTMRGRRRTRTSPELLGRDSPTAREPVPRGASVATLGNPRGINSVVRESTIKTDGTQRLARDHCVSAGRLRGRTRTPLQGGGRWFETTSAHNMFPAQTPIRPAARSKFGDVGHLLAIFLAKGTPKLARRCGSLSAKPR